MKTPHRLWHRLKFILWDSDSTYTELMLGTCYVGWAVVLLLTNTTLLVTSKSLSPMADLAGQVVWGSVFLITGVLKLVGVLMPNRVVAAIGALFGMLIWLFVTGVITLSAGFTTGSVVYVTFAVTCALTLFRKVRQQRDIVVHVHGEGL